MAGRCCPLESCGPQRPNQKVGLAQGAVSTEERRGRSDALPLINIRGHFVPQGPVPFPTLSGWPSTWDQLRLPCAAAGGNAGPRCKGVEGNAIWRKGVWWGSNDGYAGTRGFFGEAFSYVDKCRLSRWPAQQPQQRVRIPLAPELASTSTPPIPALCMASAARKKEGGDSLTAPPHRCRPPRHCPHALNHSLMSATASPASIPCPWISFCRIVSR